MKPAQTGAIDPDEQLQARVAWYYFVGNLTQQEIANRLGTSRVRVNRLLAACRENGVVQITINSRLASCVALEEALVQRYGLEAAVVVPTPENPELVRDALGVGAARYVDEHIADGMTVGIGWGQTLRALIRALPARPRRGLSVVCLQGGLAHCSRINTFEIVSDFADRYGADRHFYAAPIYAASEADRDIILRQGAIRETHEKALASDLAILTAGDITQSLIVEYGLSHPGDLDELLAAGAVGDVIGHFIDARGRPVEHSLNRRTVAVDLEALYRIPRTVFLSGGAHKREVNRAVLLGGYADAFVTDEETAAALTGDG
ncbi:sugar-binding transcriptional regulator [Spiribacter halobius]|uniref:DNA-binding transcriptional regulator n=1 Tax=Sediminicurvatus halobius TaxID=2182432 RepID=A0A2U2N111_9GAMM|nr:sugar-binding transcriptional regulator [Spiribacter halobius]PWG62790.1 DNA-binding transcriptional regulator [Spiribacter halobius]UEX77063.1 sugar-binding transcriptional regulator [Spiribacter halobius]